MSNLLSILNPEDESDARPRAQIQLTSPTDSSHDPPSEPESISSEAMDDIAEEAAAISTPTTHDHPPHQNCPCSLDCLPDTDRRPQHTLPVILRCAILGSPKQRLTIRDIYAAMENKYAYYRTAGQTWKQSVRHHLSLNRLFERQIRPPTDPGFGSYWTVNLQAPPGTKRPRKRGRPNKGADADAKKRGRPRKDDPAPPATPMLDDSPEIRHPEVLHQKILQPEVGHHPLEARQPRQMVLSAHLQDRASSSSAGQDEYESEEETRKHPWEAHARMSVTHLQWNSRDGPLSAPPARFTEEDRVGAFDSLQNEIFNLRKQTADAVQVSVKLTDQLQHAQKECQNIKSDMRRVERVLEEEKRQRLIAEDEADLERRRRMALELELKAMRLRGSPTPR